MLSDRSPLSLRAAATLGLLFLHLPILLIFLYAFTTEERSFQFPPPGLTTQVVRRRLVRPARHLPPLYLSLQVAAIATVIALILGTLVAAAMTRTSFFGRDQISLLILLPIAYPASSRHGAAVGLRDPGHPLQHLDHHPRPRDLLHRHRLQQRRRPPAPVVRGHPGGVGRPWRNAFQTFRHVLLPTWARPCWRVGCWPSPCRSMRSSSPSSPPDRAPGPRPCDLDAGRADPPTPAPVTNVVAHRGLCGHLLPHPCSLLLTRGGFRDCRHGQIGRLPMDTLSTIQTALLIGSTFEVGQRRKSRS